MEFTHLNQDGNANMVDISEKEKTKRTAKAKSILKVSAEVIEKIQDKSIPKGDVFATARIAGILAAKKTDSLIPLCHQVPITSIEINFSIDEMLFEIEIRSEVSTIYGTGVEMEALTAVSVAALTIYDMCKALDKKIIITETKLLEKIGGKSGNFFIP